MQLADGWSMRALGCAWNRVNLGRKLGAACLVAFVSMGVGCASGMNDKQSGEPCTRTDQCAAGLFCSGGACRPSPRRPAEVDAQTFEEDAGPSAVGK